jgi:hypothetical protein
MADVSSHPTSASGSMEYWVPVVQDVGDERCVYWPTGDLDTEYPTLAVYVIDHIEPA